MANSRQYSFTEAALCEGIVPGVAVYGILWLCYQKIASV